MTLAEIIHAILNTQEADIEDLKGIFDKKVFLTNGLPVNGVFLEGKKIILSDEDE